MKRFDLDEVRRQHQIAYDSIESAQARNCAKLWLAEHALAHGEAEFRRGYIEALVKCTEITGQLALTTKEAWTMINAEIRAAIAEKGK